MAIQRQRLPFTFHPQPQLPPSQPWAWRQTCGTSAARRPSYLVVLSPAVLNQVPHVVDLAGVTPAPWRGLAEWRQPKQVHKVGRCSRWRQPPSRDAPHTRNAVQRDVFQKLNSGSEIHPEEYLNQNNDQGNLGGGERSRSIWDAGRLVEP